MAGGFHQSSFTSFGRGLNTMGTSTSTSQRTVINSNGERVTVTEKTVRHSDGRVEKTVEEEKRDPRTGQVTRRMIQGGDSASSQAKAPSYIRDKQ
jgi:DnaJ family protein B protein 6